MWRVLKLAARAAVWRTTPDPPLVGLPVLLGFAVVMAVVRIALQLLAAGSWHAFNPYGLNAVVAWIALELAVAALFVRPAARATALSAMFILSIFADIVNRGHQARRAGFRACGRAEPVVGRRDRDRRDLCGRRRLVGRRHGERPWQPRTAIAAPPARQSRRLVGGVIRRQCAGAPRAGIRAARLRRPQRQLVGICSTHSIEKETAKRASRLPKSRGSRKRSPRCSKREVARLAPPRKGVTDFYALGIAGWADQDVFVKELDGGLQAIASVLPIKDRTVRLINRRDTLETVPLADLQNFQAAVRAIGGVMDKDKDVLVLFMTSHGEKTGFALELPGAMAELTPQQVASTLDGEGIKNRVVIVSACYSGIFVPPLENANTIVMTASDAQEHIIRLRAERDWTYFGDAFFRQSLHPGTDFKNAFDHARILIQGWELMDHAPPSNPQGQFGPALVDKLAPLFASAQSAAQ